MTILFNTSPIEEEKAMDKILETLLADSEKLCFL